jgi:hypothetical protein
MSNVFGAGARIAVLGLAAAAALTFSVPAFAGETVAKPQKPAAEASPLLAGIREMVKRIPVSSTGVREWPDGTLAIGLGGSFLNVLVAQQQPDGSFSAVCVAAPDLEKALAAPTAAPAFEEK